MFDRAVVTVCGMLWNVQRQSDSLRNDLVAARVVTAAAVRNQRAARAREAEALSAWDNVRTELTQVRNSFNHFREWLSSRMLALLNIFDSIVGQGVRVLWSRLISFCRLRVERIQFEFFFRSFVCHFRVMLFVYRHLSVSFY